MCRRATGGPYAVLAWFRGADLCWSGEAPVCRRSSSIATRGFCSRCGTPLFLAYDDSDQIAVMVGVIDDPAAFIPSHHYGCESRLPWVDAGRALPSRPTADDPRPR